MFLSFRNIDIFNEIPGRGRDPKFSTSWSFLPSAKAHTPLFSLKGVIVRTIGPIVSFYVAHALAEGNNLHDVEIMNLCLGRYFVVWKKMNKFVDVHSDLNGKTFSEVYKTRPEFVSFTKTWTGATGEYKLWADYVKKRDVEENKQASQKFSGSTSIPNDGGS